MATKTKKVKKTKIRTAEKMLAQLNDAQASNKKYKTTIADLNQKILDLNGVILNYDKLVIEGAKSAGLETTKKVEVTNKDGTKGVGAAHRSFGDMITELSTFTKVYLDQQKAEQAAELERVRAEQEAADKKNEQGETKVAAS